MKTIQILCIVLFLFSSVQQVEAQEVTAKRLDNPEWVQVTFLKFIPGKREMAEKIISDYFMKADQNAGIKAPISLRMLTGEYDYILVWDLSEGLETFNYQISPEDASWMNELTKLAGGQEEAGQVMSEFFSYVELWKSQIARKE